MIDILVRERPCGSRELVQADGEGGRVLKVEQLVCRDPAVSELRMAGYPQGDGQIGRDRRQLDRDAGDFVALADPDWPVLLTSVDAGSDGAGSAMGPKGRLVTVSE